MADAMEKVPRGRGEMLLYLDLDGVLHHHAVHRTRRRGVYMKQEGRTLFEHAQLLEDLLEPFPSLQIVLATSWVRALSYSKTAKRLPPGLRSRVIGATFHSKMNESVFAAQPRGVQIAEDVYRRSPRSWLALDDDDDGWPDWSRGNLVCTHGELGIGEPTVLAQLKERLQLMHANCGILPIDSVRLPSRHHLPQDHQSLLMHREAVRLILDDPSLVLTAQTTLARWMAMGSQRSMTLWEQWKVILEQRAWDLAVEDSELGRELRQASPLSTLLPQETRLEIIARVRRMQGLNE